MRIISRRCLIKLGLLGGLASGLGCGGRFGKAFALPTPAETEGPFYPVNDQADKDADLTHIDGHGDSALGQYILIGGRVTDVAGHPLAEAMIAIWQADANGRYHHPLDSNPAPADANFQGWAIISSDDDGFFRFRTVMPGAYPATQTWTRPPHIHFKIAKQGYATLITQMYFPDQELNTTDLLLNRKSPTERSAMIAKNAGQQGNWVIYEYNVILDLLHQ